MSQLRVVAWTTAGAVRGECRHRHRTYALALKCRERDVRACDRRGLLSDREIVPWLDGDTLVSVDGDETWIAGDPQAYATAVGHYLVDTVPLGSVLTFDRSGRWSVAPPAARRPRQPRDQAVLGFDQTATFP